MHSLDTEKNFLNLIYSIKVAGRNYSFKNIKLRCSKIYNFNKFLAYFNKEIFRKSMDKLFSMHTNCLLFGKIELQITVPQKV